MATVREIIADDKARGVAEADTLASMAEIGIDPAADLDLDLAAAKTKGAARLAAKSESVAPPPATPRELNEYEVAALDLVRPRRNPLKGLRAPAAISLDAPIAKAATATPPPSPEDAAALTAEDKALLAARDRKLAEAVKERGGEQEFEGPVGKLLTLPAKAFGAAKGLAAAAGSPYEAAGEKRWRTKDDDTRREIAERVTKSKAALAPSVEQIDKERQERKLVEGAGLGANTVQWLGNAVSDLGTTIAGLAEFANELGGITVVPKGETLGAAQERSLATGEALGAGSVGSSLALLKSIGDGEANSLATHPFSTLFTLEPAFSALKTTGAFEGVRTVKAYAAKKIAAQLVALELRTAVPETGLPSWSKQVSATVQRVFTDGVSQANPHMAAILDGLIHGSESAKAAVQNIAGRIAKQFEQGAAKPVQPDVERVTLGMIPAGESRVARAAEAQAAKAADDAARAKAKAAQADVAAAGEPELEATPQTEVKPSTETAIAPVPLERIAAAERVEVVKRMVADALNEAAKFGDEKARDWINKIRGNASDYSDAILHMTRKAAEKQAAGEAQVAFADIDPDGSAAAIPIVDAVLEPSLAEQAAKGLADTLRQEADVATQAATQAALQAESAGALPQVEAGPVNVPPHRARMGGALEGPDAFTAPNLARTFGVGRDVAEATVALADAMGLDKSRIRVTKGGAPGAGALEQGARSVTMLSGGGLVEEGLRGIVDPIGAVEFDKDIAGHYAKAHGSHIINADVRDVDFSQFKGADHLHASPVCKRYSVAKVGGGELPLDLATAQATARAITEIQPRAFTLENVPGYEKSAALKTITDALAKNGYKYDAAIYNAADYGVPQNRRRLLLRAWKEGEAPPPAPVKQPRVSWDAAISDLLPGLPESQLALWQVERLRANGVALDRPTLVMGGSGVKGAIPFARAGEPAPTIKATPGEPVRVVLPRPDGSVVVKQLSERAIARLQGVPDSYPLPDKNALARTILGNGVPPPLAKAVFGPMLDAVEPQALFQADGSRRVPATQQILARLRQHEWMTPDEVVAKYGIGAIPDYLNGVAEFIAEQNVKLREGRMTARDIAKAYINTITSIKAQAQNAAGFEAKTGFKLPPDATTVVNGKRMVRPEDATSAWLLSPEGKTLLDAVEAGLVTPEMWQPLVKMRDAFGSNAIKNWGLSESKNWNLHNLPEVTDAINAAKGDTAAISRAVTKLVGVGARKDGFIKHLLGLGDTATVDARAVAAWLGDRAAPELAKIANEAAGPAERFVVQQVQSRVNEIVKRLGLDPQTGPHLVHHLIWDRFKNEKTGHDIIYKAMRLAQGAKASVEFLAGGEALIRALEAPDASSGAHELAHIARRWVLNEEGGFTPKQVKHAEDWAGAKDGKWNVAAEEKFARGFERYLRDGLAPTPKLAQIFAKFKEWLGRIYAKLAGSEIDLQISPEMRRVYDTLVQRGQPDAGKRLVAKADLAVQQGQRLDLHDLLPEVPKTRRLAIEEAATVAAKAKRDALAAGFDENALAVLRSVGGSDAAKAKAAADFAGWLAKNNLPPDASVYRVGRHVADYFLGRNVDAPVDGLAQVLKDLGVPERVAPKAAAFLMAEAELGQRAKMIDLSYGAPRRPTAEVEQWTYSPDGGLIPRPEDLRLSRVRGDVAAPHGPALKGQEMFYEMAGRQLPEESPKAWRTDNPMVNSAIDEVTRIVKEVYYPKRGDPTTMRSSTPIEHAVGMPAPDLLVQQFEQGLKELTPERIGQRVLDAFDADTTQTLRSAKIRKAALDLARARAHAEGLAGAPLRKMLAGWLAQLEAPSRQSAISKSRFPELFTPDGKPLFTRKDMAAVNAKAAPRVKAEVMQAILGDMAEAAFGAQTLRDLAAELYRFMTKPDGTIDEAAVGTPSRYAESLARRVLDQGEAYPALMPYAGKEVAGALRGMAANADATSAAKLDKLADWAERYVPVAATGGLAKHVGAWWKNLVRSTTPPPDMVNVHAEPSALATLNAHFASLSSTETAGWGGLVRAYGQHTKKMVVAASLRALTNNAIANTIVQGLRRGDPLHLPKVALAAYDYYLFKKGALDKLDPRKARIFEALDRTDMVGHTELAADIGKSDLGKQLEAALPQAAVLRRRLSVATRGVSDMPGQALGSTINALAGLYSNHLGDTPFRIEEALNAYNAFERKVKALEVGNGVTLPQGGTRSVRVERVPSGYTITDMSGPHAVRKVSFTESEGLQSRAMTDALAQAANVAQERVFFDYSRIGNFGKWLRGGQMSLLSGIFAWFMKAVDIPGVKKGIVAEMMRAPYQVETNSPAVRMLQAQENLGLAFRRAAAVGVAQASMQAQRKSEALRRAAGYNPAELGMVLQAVTNPAMIDSGTGEPTHVWARNISPVMSSMPTSAVLSGLQQLVARQAFGDVLGDPAMMLATMQPDAKLTEPQRASKRLLLQMARGEMLSSQQLMQMFGLGGGPLLTLLERIRNTSRRGQTVTPHELAMEWAKMTFGSTPQAAFDVGAGAVGEIGGARGNWPATWSSYGKTFSRQGFHGGQPQDDETGFARWALRQMLGVGWSLVPLAEQGNPETEGAITGTIQRAYNDRLTAMRAVLLAEAKRRANIAAREWADNKGDLALKAAHSDAAKLVGLLDDLIKDEAEIYKANLAAQAKSLLLDKPR